MLNEPARRFPSPAEIISSDAVPGVTTIKELVNLVEDGIPYPVEDLQYEVDFLPGRDYAESAKSIASFKNGTHHAIRSSHPWCCTFFPSKGSDLRRTLWFELEKILFRDPRDLF